MIYQLLILINHSKLETTISIIYVYMCVFHYCWLYIYMYIYNIYPIVFSHYGIGLPTLHSLHS